MKTIRVVPIAILSAAILAACNGEVKQQLATVQHVDSLRVDSLSNIRKDLLEEVMTSTQFVNQLNTELAKARALSSTTPAQLETSTEVAQVNEERKRVVAKIAHLVARLDSVQGRVANLRTRVSQLSQKDSGLVAQVAAYEKTISDLQASTEKQRAEFQGMIDRQGMQIASLSSKVDTLTTVRAALTDTVGQLTTEKNTAYYIVGTKDELIKKGILVSEGRKRFFLVGGRKIEPARDLDPTAFTKIDRLSNRTIALPEGEYEILSRQNPTYAAPQVQKDGKIAGGLTIEQPERFWGPSRFLIIVRS
jgi:predicted  nucleic acid-binding Zn-ribbon protein